MSNIIRQDYPNTTMARHCVQHASIGKRRQRRIYAQKDMFPDYFCRLMDWIVRSYLRPVKSRLKSKLALAGDVFLMVEEPL